MRFSKPAFAASNAPEAQAALRELTKLYGNAKADADVVVALGGDGLMLQTIHRNYKKGLPIYGMNCGSVGFLMNDYSPQALLERLDVTEAQVIYPLRMKVKTASGKTSSALAFNEVSMLRETRQAAKLRISIDGRVRLDEMICDGILLSTPAGSTAYNLSVNGPILPIDAALLALTPISAFRPRRWRGALLPRKSKVLFEILEADKRPVSAVADHTEVREVVEVSVVEDQTVSVTILFDADRSLEERMLAEQFVTG
ncbi:MAG: NAD kinase [Alphaproteobacteria bacterium]|nr:NAD kinase [Alphaproteobacteria bacterium]